MSRDLARLRQLLGLPSTARIEIADDAAANACDAVVCMRVADMPTAIFPDDVITECALGCGFKVRHRPYMPTAPKVCSKCAVGFATARRQ